MRRLARVALTVLLILAGPAAIGRAGAKEEGGHARHASEARTVTRPRLFFPAGEVAALRERARTTHAAIWAELQAYCERHLDDQPPASMPGENYDRKGSYLEEHFLSHIVNFSLAYVIGGNARYLDTAKRWLMTLTRMPEWEGAIGGGQPDAGLYTQFGQIALAAGYDWLYDPLSPEERDLIRSKMAYVAGQVYRAAHGGEWWSGAYWHHDMILPVTGLGIAGLTLSGEDPRAEQWLERALEQVNMVFDRIGDDGAWHEGAAAWSWGTMTLLIFADMLERCTGQSLWDRPWLEETAWYRLYVWLPPDRVVNFDDAHASGGYGTLAEDCGAIMYRLAHQYHNPYAQWLGDLDAAAKQSEYSIAWRFLWRDASIAPKPPTDLAPSRFFENQDLAISRAGWGEHDPVVAFTCGATVGRRALTFARNADGSTNQGLNTGSNHTHPDQLSFVVYADGDYLVAPQGYGYYSAEDENSILIDGRGPRHYADSHEPIVSAGRVEQVSFTPAGDEVVGQAAACYPPDLGVKQAQRRLSYAKPDTVTISDAVALGAPHGIEWRFHAGDGVKIEQRGSDYWFVGSHASLHFEALAPADLQLSVQQGGKHRWDRDHQWLSVRWPSASAEAKARFRLQIVR